MNANTSGLFRVIVRFENHRGQSLGGRDWTVELRDEDPLFDGVLGRATLDEDGAAGILFSVADVQSPDSPGERQPDLYFVLHHYGREVYRTRVEHDVDFESLDPVSGEPDRLTQDFGTIRVNIGT